MAKCRFERGGAMSIVIVGGRELAFNGGVATRTFALGEHPVHWYARGGPEVSYRLKVTGPSPAGRLIEGTLDATGKDAGLFWLVVAS